MTERTTTIKLALEDQIGNRLLEIRKQRDALLARPSVKLNIDSDGISQAQRAMAQTRANAVAATRDMSVLGDAVTSKAVAPMAQYSALLGAVLLVTQKLGPGLVTALQRSNVEFTRQRDLMRFWGTSGYLSIGIDHFKSNLAGFVSTSGSGFTKWLQNTSAALSQYRTALVASAAVMIGMAAAAALSSKSAQNYIQSTLDSRLMQRKLSDRAGAEKWIQSAEGTDWSAGRESRMGAFQTILSKNPYMGQTEAQKGTEDLEKFFFANQEMLKKKGFESVEALASAMSAPTMSGEDALKFEDIFGLGFQNLTPRARLGRVSTEAGKLDMAEEVGMRPEEILTKRFTATTRAMGDAVLPPLLAIMNMFVKLSDIVGKIPGLGGALGWAAVLAGIAAAGLTVISVLAGLIGPLGMVIGLIKGAHLATIAFTAAQWLLNVALTANPIGVAVVAIVALIGVLYLLEKKFGIVTKAWNALKSGMSSLGGAFKDAGGMGVLKIAVDTLVASNPMLKILLFQVDFLKKIWLGGETLNKIMGGAMTIWQSIGQFVSWIGDILTTIQNTLGGGVGGVADKVLGGAGAAAQSVVKAAGDFLNPQNPAAASAHPGTDNAGNPLPFEPDLWYSSKDSGQWRKGSDLIKEWGPRVNDARDLYKSAASTTNPTEKSSGGSGTVTKTDVAGNTYSAPAPAKADSSKSYVTYGDNGTFDVHNTETGAVSKGFKTEKEAKDSIPKMAVGGTITGSGSIIGHAGEEVSPASAVVGAKSTLERMTEAAEGGIEAKTKPADKITGSTYVEGGLQAYGRVLLDRLFGGSPSMDVEGSITGSGSIIGHQGEEISPASAVVGAKTTLESMTEAAAGSRGGPNITIGGTTVNINVDKMSSDIDLQKAISQAGDEFDRKLLFRLRNGLDSGSLRGIGYLRG